ncbi:MAG TPA: hypothetical protein VIU65_09235, partial [Pyrinomonadaceae bacterium]
MKLLTTTLMSRMVALVLFILLAVFLHPASQLLASAGGSIPQLPIQRRSSPAVETVQFRSTILGKTLPYNVILPRDYYTSRTTRFPVLYLLHGLDGHFDNWITKTNVADYA